MTLPERAEQYAISRGFPPSGSERGKAMKQAFIDGARAENKKNVRKLKQIIDAANIARSYNEP